MQGMAHLEQHCNVRRKPQGNSGESGPCVRDLRPTLEPKCTLKKSYVHVEEPMAGFSSDNNAIIWAPKDMLFWP